MDPSLYTPVWLNVLLAGFVVITKLGEYAFMACMKVKHSQCTSCCGLCEGEIDEKEDTDVEMGQKKE
jgi:hypothetical protein